MHGVDIWLQPGGPGTVAPFHPKNATLAYTLPEFDVALPFAPTDFTQVNFGVNRVLVRRALALLAPQPGERVADFFCGLGNFTLPIARQRRDRRRRRRQRRAGAQSAGECGAQRPRRPRILRRREPVHGDARNQWKRSARSTAR